MDHAWLVALPKAEVHVHLEGCVPPDLLSALAARAGVAVPSQGPFVDLAAMLAGLDAACALVRRDGDLVELAYRFGQRSIATGVTYSDVIVNPAHWPAWHGRLPAFLTALDEGFARAEAEGASPVGICPSIGRWMSEEAANRLVDELGTLALPRVVGLSLDGNEAAPGAGSDRFLPAFNAARSLGLGLAAHAGESSGPDGVRHAIEVLGAQRIDHGVRAIDDVALVGALASSGVILDICPSSNVALGVAASLAEHPIDRLRRCGVRLCVNTDDPVLFDTDLPRELERCATTFAWDDEVLITLARTSIEACFAAPEHRAAMLEALDAIHRASKPSGGTPKVGP